MGKIKDLSNIQVNLLCVTDKREIRHSSKSKERTSKAGHGRSYWLCECSCGNNIWVRSDVLEKGKIKSCGCDKRLNSGDGVMGVVYAGYRKNAIRRNIEFNISKEFFKEVTNKNCYYCGFPPSNYREIKNYYGDFKYNGIDRIDNNVGYEESNCVPCCKKCNRSKDTMSKNDFITWIKNVYNNLKNNGFLDESY